MNKAERQRKMYKIAINREGYDVTEAKYVR